MRFRFLLLIGTCALLPAGVSATGTRAQSAVALELHANAQIAKARIVLGDVAVIGARSADMARIAGLDLGNAPRVGYVERFTRAQIAQALRRQLGVEAIAWSGADSVAVRVQSHVVSPDALAAAAVDAVRKEFAAAHPGLDVRVAAQPAALEVPIGTLELRARRVNGTALAARMPQWVDVFVNGAVYRSAVVQLAVSQQRKVYVALRALEQGAWVGAGDFSVVDANVAGVATVPVGTAMQPFRLREPLREGQLLTNGVMLGGGTILRGDNVRLVIQSGQIGIETTGVAMADAAPGEKLAVRPDGASDIVSGRVGQAGTVIIE